jgi:glutamine cyclotransferase
MVEKRKFDDLYKKWRLKVLKRDKNKCQFPYCRVRTKIQVHHIYRWADAIELRYNVFNGICLCRKHHKYITGKENLYAGIFAEIALKNGNNTRH